MEYEHHWNPDDLADLRESRRELLRLSARLMKVLRSLRRELLSMDDHDRRRLRDWLEELDRQIEDAPLDVSE